MTQNLHEKNSKECSKPAFTITSTLIPNTWLLGTCPVDQQNTIHSIPTSLNPKFPKPKSLNPNNLEPYIPEARNQNP